MGVPIMPRGLADIINVALPRLSQISQQVGDDEKEKMELLLYAINRTLNRIERMLDLQNGGNEESSTDTVITDSGIGSKTEVDTLRTDESCTQSLFTTESFD